MRRHFWSLLLVFLCLAAPLTARHSGEGSCGTTRETHRQSLFLHRQALRARQGTRLAASRQATAGANLDIGDVAVMEDSGIASHLNQFNLDSQTLTFTPAGTAFNPTAQYRYAAGGAGYDSAAAAAGAPLLALGDDDSRLLELPFAFPFFGAAYSKAYINSDGNITFTAGDNASSHRSLGRVTAGPPRISPLFDDLDPSKASGGIRVLAEAGRVVVSWASVPEYSAAGIGVGQTFQVKLYPDGRIEFAYSGITAAGAVVGIAPGKLAGATALVDFRTDASATYAGAVVEWFATGRSIDVVAAAQKFYQTHEDSYDYLVIYNNEGIAAMGDALAYEDTVRSSGAGFGVDPADAGQQYGSASRLRAVLNMGKLSQYGTDPQSAVLGRYGDTPLSILAHESGHLFLAFASVNDPQDPTSRPMLGYQGAHWSFLFDSEASFLEGEQIVDRDAGTLPPHCSNLQKQFMTCDTVSRFSPLDQYLMGFRPPTEAPDVFVVSEPAPFQSPLQHPPGVHTQFDGVRRNISVDDVIEAMGRRIPDSTVAQRRFRFGFILIVPAGTDPNSALLRQQVDQVDGYRQAFEPYYATATGDNASAGTSLKRSMKLSMFPAAGVLAGTTATATLTLQTAPESDVTVRLQASAGHAALPAFVTIPAGATSASFTVAGLSQGVEEVTAAPVAGASYETAFARVQVGDVSGIKLVTVSGGNQASPGGGPLPEPIVVRLTDGNDLPYVGAVIAATASAGGSVAAGAIATDAQGEAAFQWTPGPAAVSQLTLALAGAPQVSVTVSGGAAAPAITSVVNTASGAEGVAAGSLATVRGVNLAGGQTLEAPGAWPLELGGVSVALNGQGLQVFYASDAEIGVYVPPDAALGAGTMTATAPGGAKTSATVNVAASQPGILPGAIAIWPTKESASTVPVHAGDYLEIYCTGLGPTVLSDGLKWTVGTPLVFIGSTPVPALYSGLTPDFLGLYQVNVQVPAGLAPGAQPVSLSINQTLSNSVNILVQ